MKKVLYLLFLLPLISCDKGNEPTQKNHKFLERVLGLYELRSAYTNVPVDLNHDGVAETDLFQEAQYCNMGLHLDSYKCEFTYNSRYDYRSFGVYTPYSKYILETESYSTCFMYKSLFAEYNVDEKTKELSLVTNDYYNDFAAEYNTEFVDVDWEDDIVFFTFKKEFYNSSGEWQEVMLYMEFEKFMDYEIVY